MGLNKKVREEILVCLADIYPAWQSTPLLDEKRVLTPEGIGSFTIAIVPHRGITTSLGFRGHLISATSVIRLADIIRELQPELLGRIILPGRAMSLHDIHSHITCWCEYMAEAEANNASVETAMEKLVQELDQLLDISEVVQEIFTPLVGLRFIEDTQEVRLPPNIIVRAISPEELSRLASDDVMFHRKDEVYQHASAAIVFTNNIAIAVTVAEDQKPNGTQRAIQDVQQQIVSVLQCLHIVKPGAITAISSEHQLKPKVLPYMCGFATTPNNVSVNPFSLMEFTENDIAELIEVHGQYGTNEREQLRIAIARLCDAENRLSPVDSLLDSVIGMEVLLNPSDYGELAFRVALNYAFLAEESERRVRYETVKDIQAIRNRIVHGGLNLRSKDAQLIHRYAKVAKECLRDTIKCFLKDETLQGNSKLDSDFWLNRIIPTGE